MKTINSMPTPPSTLKAASGNADPFQDRRSLIAMIMRWHWIIFKIGKKKHVIDDRAKNAMISYLLNRFSDLKRIM